METKVLQITNVDANTFFSKIDELEDSIIKIVEKSNENNKDKLLTVKETAKFFSVSDVTVWQWTKKGLLTAYKIANRKYYKQSEVENALTEMNA